VNDPSCLRGSQSAEQSLPNSNALITPSGYFQACFSATPYAQTFASWLVIAYNVSTIAFSAHATATLEKVGTRRGAPQTQQ
jgi:hypothetical protein